MGCKGLAESVGCCLVDQVGVVDGYLSALLDGHRLRVSAASASESSLTFGRRSIRVFHRFLSSWRRPVPAHYRPSGRSRRIGSKSEELLAARLGLRPGKSVVTLEARKRQADAWGKRRHVVPPACGGEQCLTGRKRDFRDPASLKRGNLSRSGASRSTLRTRHARCRERVPASTG